MSAREWLHRALAGVCALGMATGLAGCQRTLVFAEHDGLNLAIRADPKTSPPLEVNFGLNCAVGTIVPPIDQDSRDHSPAGEAVNMFAGFQVLRGDAAITPATGPRVDLRIANQFASGAAALAISTNPAAVAALINMGSEPAVRIASGLRPRVEALSQRILDISNAQAARAAQDLRLPAPPQNPRTRLQDALARAWGNAADLDLFEREFTASVRRTN